MYETFDNTRKALNKLLPLSVLSETVCFVFYDDHPRDEFNVDITICCKNGLVQEYYQRELLTSISLENVTKIIEIKNLRNCKGDLFYLVFAENELILISRKKELIIHHRIKNIETYEIQDSDCKGYASLKIVLKDDAVPLVFDDNFDKLGERILNIDVPKSEESLPIISQLRRKLIEVKYTTKCNENKLEEYLNLRQMSAFSIYQRTESNHDTLYKININEISNFLQIKTKIPIVKCCNKKVVIITSILNKNAVPISEISVLLHGTKKQSITYTTKLFEQIPQCPYWKEQNSQINGSQESAVVAVVELKEIQDNVLSRIDFNVVISYIKEGKTYLMPMESVKISSLDTIGENFDVLYDKKIDLPILMLSVLATSVSTNLCLRHIQNSPEEKTTMQEIFCKFLKMEQLDVDNVALHKISPHHMLYGVLVIFQDNNNKSDHMMNVEVFSRNHSQVVALIHYIYDAVPYRIIATTQDCKILALTKELSKYNESVDKTNFQLSYKDYGSSFVKQTTAIKEYFDNCMIAMSESKDTETKNKAGFEIDLLAQGQPKFLEFRNNLLDESLNGIRSLSLQEQIDDVQDLTLSDD